MNQKLQNLLDAIQKSSHFSDDEITALSKTVKEVEKEMDITTFKLDRTEKVKRTTAILLEETIEELEQKRKAVEAQNRELEIETSLDSVRTIALIMNKPDDMLEVRKTISQQLQSLGVREIRNVQTAIFYEEKGTYMNYAYYAKHVDETVLNFMGSREFESSLVANETVEATVVFIFDWHDTPIILRLASVKGSNVIWLCKLLFGSKRLEHSSISTYSPFIALGNRLAMF